MERKPLFFSNLTEKNGNDSHPEPPKARDPRHQLNAASHSSRGSTTGFFRSNSAARAFTLEAMKRQIPSEDERSWPARGSAMCSDQMSR